MNSLAKATGLRPGLGLLACASASLLLAFANLAAARRAERLNPPRGKFLQVGGVRLHYTRRGSGHPVILLHGNAVTGDDFNTSGVAERLLETHEVIIFDRPGFGHSSRPRGRSWSANQQADLIHQAIRALGIERPIVVGHSWGAIVALAFAVRHPEEAAAVVPISGYYFPTARPDVAAVSVGALPLVGDVLRYTVSPLLGRLLMPLLKRAMFSPAPIPARFAAGYSDGLALRPSQIRATSLDGVLMIPSAMGLQDHYRELTMPVVIIAGDGDKIVWMRRARRLHACIPGSVLRIVAGAGHMVHHFAPERVAEAVRSVTPVRKIPHGERSRADRVWVPTARAA